MSDPFSMRERKCSSLRRNASSACARSIAVARTFATAWRKCVSWMVNSRGCAECTPRMPNGRVLPCTRTLRLATTSCGARSGALPKRVSVARFSTTTVPVERSTYPACESGSAGKTVRPTAPSRHPTPARSSSERLSARSGPVFHYGLHTRPVPCITARPNWCRRNDIPRTAMSEYPVLKDLAIIFAVSLLVILVFHRFKLPALPGFIVAGVLLGPNALGLVSDVHQVESLAEVGVILLLFTIGIEFSLSRLREMGRQVVVGGGAQVGLTVMLTWVLALTLHLSGRVSLLLGFLVALSSTAIVLKGLADKGEIDAPHGRLATGVLIFQDLCVVPMMLVLPFLAGRSGGGTGALLLALGQAVLGA